jgi:DNA processing protein|tara:strand:+ start:155 stop:397 length:243 start_codon:yes stop_codon:yes gene_type:complete
MQKNNINHLFYTDKQYPNKLKLCTDWNNQRFLSIVGTIKSTQFGKEYTQNLISELAQYNIVIVIGLAFGIDIARRQSSNT